MVSIDSSVVNTSGGFFAILSKVRQEAISVKLMKIRLTFCVLQLWLSGKEKRCLVQNIKNLSNRKKILAESKESGADG